ncbi:MAG: enoyl-CoA hydratase/isomerase family protein [Planctomycetes bacterium]|nr:enoyl-CoA hydratase/isomerase family protein [Planctomycetota bacterium]
MAATAIQKHLRVEPLENGRVLRLVLDAGKGNVVTGDVADELRAALDDAQHRRSLCAVLLDHAGTDFSFGASVQEHTPAEVGAMLPRLHAAALALLRFPVPVLACVRGRCLGGGFELAQCTTLVFATPGAVLAQPEIQLGVFAPLGSVILPRVIGPRHAADLLLSGRNLGAEEAQRLGLVHTLSEDPTAAALAWAKKHLATRSASSLRIALHALRGWDVEAFARELKSTEALYLERLMQTHDAPEGIGAFLAKRPPVWKDQ